MSPILGFDYSSLFADRARDLLRPGPHGKYIGLRHTDDDDRTEAEEHVSNNSPLPGEPSPGNGGDRTAPVEPESEAIYPESEDFADVPLGVELDEFLPDTITMTSHESLPEESPLLHDVSRFIQVGDKRFLKSSVVAAFLTSNRGNKVPMRTQK